MVGYRNNGSTVIDYVREFIRHSDGGVSELLFGGLVIGNGVYQAFRWWGIGT